jgi:hypothetical protein
MVAMLRKMREVGQPLTTFTIQPIPHGMIEFLALAVICDTKPSGFKGCLKVDPPIHEALHELDIQG